MLSIVVLVVILAAILLLYKKFKDLRWLYLAVLTVSILIIEVVIYIYFIFLVGQGRCFLLIGNQKALDFLIQARLTNAIYFSQGKPSFFYRVDPVLGYTLGREKNTGAYVSNKSGLRDTKDYQLLPERDKLRLAVFGDSFVFCDDEKNEDSWPSLLAHSSSGLEVLNFGVSGYGLGQSYLRYLNDGRQYHPDIVFFNYITTGARDKIDPKDFFGTNNLRMAGFYRVRFSIEDGVLVDRATAPYDLLQKDFREKYIYQPLGINPDRDFWGSPIFSHTNLGLLLKTLVFQRMLIKESPEVWDEDVNLAILKDLLEICERDKTPIIFFYSSAFKNLPVSVQHILNEHKGIIIFAESTNMLNDIYTKYNVHKELHNSSNHFNALGNTYYAQAVLDILKSRTWLREGKSFHYNEKIHGFIAESSVLPAN